MLLLSIIFLTTLAFGRGLTDDQKNVTKIATRACTFGGVRCIGNTMQVCDGSFFVTKKLCGLYEQCDIKKECVPREDNIRAAKKVSKDFYYWRSKECRIGQIKCNQRFIRQCIKNKWIDSTCAENEYCNPIKGCTEKVGLTRMKERELNIPRVPKIPFLRQY